jgi:PAS domain S-box-containing protein
LRLPPGESLVPDTLEFYRRLVEGSPDGILVVEGQRVVYANPSAGQLFGWPIEEMKGALLGPLFCSDSQRELEEGVPERADLKLVRPDGTALFVEVLGADIGGGRTQVIVRDITERARTEATLRESEERFALALAGAQEGVWDWNLETGAVNYSKRWKEMLGYEDHEISPHVSEWERLLHPEDRSRAYSLSEALERGASTYAGEFRLRHKNGHYVDVLSRGFPIRREPGGPVVRIVGTHFDLTERKRQEAERARTDLLARLVFAQEDERRRIAREMHDQFGELLTALARGIDELSAACAGEPRLSGPVEAIRKVAHQLDRDVDQLVWDLRPTALDDLGLRAALANYVQQWSARVAIPAELHTSGLLDERLPSETETALYRIAQEALTNVAKHAKARHVEIILERRPDHVSLVIEDDGLGFEPKAGGSGFGLIGMRERAALVGATVEIESAEGRGTTILVRMSAAGPPAANHE